MKLAYQNQKRVTALKNNPVKDYVWGSPNVNSSVARFSKNNNQNKVKIFAELWMGVHPNGQSHIQVIQQNGIKKQIKLSEYLDQSCSKPIQFLFKVLSIQKCLSIQVHPNKEQALILNKFQPDVYRDDNDKPEMFYTLSKFQCFLGYVKQEQFNRLINLPYFQIIRSQNVPKNPKQAMLSLTLLPEHMQKNLINVCLQNLEQIHPKRYNIQNKNNKIMKIPQDFPNDIGIVVSFFLQYLVLPPGVCYFIDSNIAHAYIHGECLQIMKSSDNVCRLGLTPKLKDINSIKCVLSQQYTNIQARQPIIKHQFAKFSKYTKNGLNLLIIQSLKEQNDQFTINKCQHVRIMIVIEGKLSIFIKQQKQQNNKQINHSDHSVQYQAGSTLLLQPNIQYHCNFKCSGGVACVGWSEFN